MRKAVVLSMVLLGVGASCLRPDPKMRPDPGDGHTLETTGAVIDGGELNRDASVGPIVPRVVRGSSRVIPDRPEIGEFDRHAADAALAAMDLSTCRDPFGPWGLGYILVTFAPDGSVVEVEVEQGPPGSPLEPGSPLTECVLAKARAVRVPPFSGKPVEVGHQVVFE